VVVETPPLSLKGQRGSQKTKSGAKGGGHSLLVINGARAIKRASPDSMIY
jgi:hypothetical protein